MIWTVPRCILEHHNWHHNTSDLYCNLCPLYRASVQNTPQDQLGYLGSFRGEKLLCFVELQKYPHSCSWQDNPQRGASCGSICANGVTTNLLNSCNLDTSMWYHWSMCCSINNDCGGHTTPITYNYTHQLKQSTITDCPLCNIVPRTLQPRRMEGSKLTDKIIKNYTNILINNSLTGDKKETWNKTFSM